MIFNSKNLKRSGIAITAAIILILIIVPYVVPSWSESITVIGAITGYVLVPIAVITLVCGIILEKKSWLIKSMQIVFILIFGYMAWFLIPNLYHPYIS